MIEIKNLHKSYRRGKEIIPNLDLSLGETGLTMIVGKSGCGKTTLLNIVGAMDLDFEGQVVFISPSAWIPARVTLKALPTKGVMGGIS